MHLNRLRLKGYLKIRDIPLGFDSSEALFFRKDLPILRDTQANVITDVGLMESAKILVGLSADNFDFMAIGDRGVNPSNLDIPLAPSPFDVGLINELNRKMIGSKSVTGSTLNLAATFLTAEGPFSFADHLEEIVNEFSIQTLSAGGVCIARKTFPSIPFGT